MVAYMKPQQRELISTIIVYDCIIRICTVAYSSGNEDECSNYGLYFVT